MVSKRKSKSEDSTWSELAKKLVFASLGSAAIAKDVVKDSKLPREVLSTVIKNAEKRKDDFLEIIAREISKFLSRINVSDELRKTLKGLKVKLNVEVEFEEKKGNLSTKTKLKSSKVSK